MSIYSPPPPPRIFKSPPVTHVRGEFPPSLKTETQALMQMKRLSEQLEMNFMCSCHHIVRQQMLKIKHHIHRLVYIVIWFVFWPTFNLFIHNLTNSVIFIVINEFLIPNLMTGFCDSLHVLQIAEIIGLYKLSTMHMCVRLYKEQVPKLIII